MEFQQTKLSKQEWEYIEIPITQDKQEILQLIINGYDNVLISYNKTISLLTFLKIDTQQQSENMDAYLYNCFFSKKINDIYEKYDKNNKILFINISSKIKVNQANIIRINSNSKNIDTGLKDIYEFIMIDFIEKLFECKARNDKKWIYYYMTIYKVSKNKIRNINTIIKTLIDTIITEFENEIQMSELIYNAVEYIEKNNNLIKYSDITLYEHQKNIYHFVKTTPTPKLILYIAPTGTGKTLTPIGLAKDHKIIYVCASRNVGLSLAKSAISMCKKIAFAFGCSCSDDVKLHYFAAIDYTQDKRSGGIKRVDNSQGQKVEIIISDIRSYLYAMYYMLAQGFERENIISYFDEPTIFLDYEEHELHETIHRNWKENVIPNIVLSSATLPKEHEIPETINDFLTRFENSQVITITSNECKKTIPIINKSGQVEMPHYLTNDYEEIKNISQHCFNNLTLLRYLDLYECCRFIKIFNEEYNYGNNETLKLDRNFASMDDVMMENIKLYYLNILNNIDISCWNMLYIHLQATREKYIKNENIIEGELLRRTKSVGYLKSQENVGEQIEKVESDSVTVVKQNTTTHQQQQPTPDFAIYITTKDSHTLTDGPTLYITNEIDKIAKFCIQQTKIPVQLLDELTEKIQQNETIKEKITKLENELDDIREKKSKSVSSSGNDTGKPESKGGKKGKVGKQNLNEEKDIGVNKINTELERLNSLLFTISLKEVYIPNRQAHLEKWIGREVGCGVITDKHGVPFSSQIDEETNIKIMSLKIDFIYKILLLFGIGVFENKLSTNTEYNELIKTLADLQKLYIIIADSNYIYGVNYQFCHSYIGRDLELTQEKIIQVLGRVGRNNIQQNYSIRFRNDEHIKLLFAKDAYKPEAQNMNLLFTTFTQEKTI